MNIAINGFGRIGRATFKALLNKKGIKVAAINDLTDTKTLANLLQYDSAYGKYEKKVKGQKGALVVGKDKFPVLSVKDPSELPWKEMKIDVVLECTGLFRTSEKAGAHLQAGAKKVVISAPGKSDDIKTIVMGVNHDSIKKNDKIVSTASCTTNCLAPATEVIRRAFGIEKAIMTTIHGYTSTQNIIDGPHKDLRRGRTAAVNIVPTTTGAAIATTKAIPQLKDKFDGMAMRVPVPVGSICDMVFITKKNVDEQKVNQAFKKAAFSAKLKGILRTNEDPIVLADIIGDPASSIVDLPLTKVVGGNMVKVVSWYDNEWGYSNRLADVVEHINKKNLL